LRGYPAFLNPVGMNLPEEQSFGVHAIFADSACSF
jgi:hypothetical protein